MIMVSVVAACLYVLLPATIIIQAVIATAKTKPTALLAAVALTSMKYLKFRTLNSRLRTWKTGMSSSKNSKFRTSKGFTLIELILYIALVAIFLSGAIFFAWDLVYGRQKAMAKQTVDQSARIAMSRIAYEVRRATDVNSITATSIELENGANDTTISLNSNAIDLTTNGAGPYILTSDQVAVTDLSFTDLSSTDQNSNNVLVSITLTQSGVAVSEQFTADTTLSETVELNSLFSESRKLLVDFSTVALSSNQKAVENIILTNIGADSITLDQLYLSWVHATGGQNLVEVSISSGVVWSGSQGTGSTIDITNTTINAGASVTVDHLEFDAKIDDSTIQTDWIMSDSSFSTSLFSFGAAPDASPTPTPSPSASPTPSPSPTSCAEVCTQSGYSAGTCRKNAGACNSQGETHVSAGDTFCTGGRNADTCCCAP